jgi:hypothetical protein
LKRSPPGIYLFILFLYKSKKINQATPPVSVPLKPVLYNLTQVTATADRRQVITTPVTSYVDDIYSYQVK